MTAEKYNRESHGAKVINASNAKDTAITLLVWACFKSDYKEPKVRFSKDTFMDQVGKSRLTTMQALAFLEDEGSMVKTEDEVGGQGKASTYALCIVGQGASEDEEYAGAGEYENPRGRYFRSMSRKHGAVQAIQMTARAFQDDSGPFPQCEFDAIVKHGTFGEAMDAKKKYEA